MGNKFALVFIVGPIVEIAVMIAVAQAIGFGPMLLLLIAFSVVGFMVTKRVGRAAVLRMQTQVDGGAKPSPQVAVDGALIGLAGVLVLVPGFVSGVIGFLLFIPPLRKLAGTGARKWGKGRVDAQFTVVGPAGPARDRTTAPSTPAAPGTTGSRFRRAAPDSAPGDGPNRPLPPGDVQ